MPLLLVPLMAGCGPRDRIVVGAKNFTESDLLAEIVARRLRNPDWARVFPNHDVTFHGLCRG